LLKGKSILTEHIKHDLNEKSVIPTEKVDKKMFKNRGRAEKEARIRYSLYLFRQTLDETKKVENVKQVSLNGLARTVYFVYDVSVLVQTLLGVLL
jgi:hypothetical protein